MSMSYAELMEHSARMQPTARAFALTLLRTYGDHLESCPQSAHGTYAARMSNERDCTCGLGSAFQALGGFG